MRSSLSIVPLWPFLLFFFSCQLVCLAQLPPGFTIQQVAHIEDATSISHVPTNSMDDNGVQRLLATSKNGKLHMVTITDNLSSTNNAVEIPTVQVQEIADFGSTVCLNGERGLQAALAHYDFDNGSPYIYVYYTDKTGNDCQENPRDGPRNKCARFLYQNNVLDRNTELILFTTPRTFRRVHNGGNMAFGKDKLLYISVGDGGGRTEAVSQQPNNLFGTIVRLNDDGSLPPTNPYAATGEPCVDGGSSVGGGVCREIFAYGIRNPFKISMNPNTASDVVRFWIGDVGHNTWEEINECGTGYAGANYGYPNMEGPCNHLDDPLNNCAVQPQFADPVYWYSHQPTGGCVVGSAFSNTGLWPPEYDHVFFGDYEFEEIYMIRPDPSNLCRNCARPTPAYQNVTFHTDAPKIVDLRFVPFRNNQALYYLMRVDDFSLRRIIYVGGSNVPPVAVIQISVSGAVPSNTVIQFDGTASFDGNGDSLTYQWDFGDGQSSTSAVTTHQYSQDGRYIVSLVVSDGGLTSLSALQEIQIGVPPVVEILSPADGTQFAVGEVFVLSGQASSKGTPLAASSLEWQVRQVHADHYHPFLTATSGNDIELSPAFEPEDFLAATNSFLRILLTATDANGLETTVTRDVLPVQYLIDFRSNPSGIAIQADGFVIKTPSSGVSWENYKLLLSAPESSGRYQFESWSTGGDRTHKVTVTADLQTIPCKVYYWYDESDDPLYDLLCPIPFIGSLLCTLVD